MSVIAQFSGFAINLAQPAGFARPACHRHNRFAIVILQLGVTVIRNLLIAALLLTALAACRTVKDRGFSEAMQMPAKPPGTARIVLFRNDAVHGRRAPVPVLGVNGQTVGELLDESLIIRDVAPGAQELTLTLRDGDQRDGMVIEPPVLRAELNAGGEWYVETLITEPCIAGTKPVDYSGIPTGTWQGNAVLSGFSLMSAALAHATMKCGAIYQLTPVWPQSTWHVNPLLAKQGAKPAEPIADSKLPQSGLSWRAVESAISNHFALNRDDYKPHRESASEANLYYQDAVLISEGADNTVIVDVGYLRVIEPVLAGQRRSLRIRYSLKADDDRLVVTEWQSVGN